MSGIGPFRIEKDETETAIGHVRDAVNLHGQMRRAEPYPARDLSTTEKILTYLSAAIPTFEVHPDLVNDQKALSEYKELKQQYLPGTEGLHPYYVSQTAQAAFRLTHATKVDGWLQNGVFDNGVDQEPLDQRSQETWRNEAKRFLDMTDHAIGNGAIIPPESMTRLKGLKTRYSK